MLKLKQQQNDKYVHGCMYPQGQTVCQWPCKLTAHYSEWLQLPCHHTVLIFLLISSYMNGQQFYGFVKLATQLATCSCMHIVLRCISIHVINLEHRNCSDFPWVLYKRIRIHSHIPDSETAGLGVLQHTDPLIYNITMIK